MAHWFDGLTKEIARNSSISRRAFLGGALGAAFSSIAALPRPALAAVTGAAENSHGSAGPAPGKNPITVAKKPPCAVSVAGNQTTQQFFAQSKYQGKSLAATMTNTILNRRSVRAVIGSVPPGHLASEFNITLGGAQVLNIRFTVPPGVTDPGAEFKVDMTFGEAYQGIRNVNYVVQKGFLLGAIDGRAIVPRHAGLASTPHPRAGTGKQADAAAAVAFRDGQPPPKVSVDPGLAAAIRVLLTKDLQNTAAKCRKAGSPLRFDAAPGNLPPEGDSTPICNDCLNNCGEASLICIAAAVAACIDSFGIGCIGIPACYATLAFCDSDCNKTGAACCQEKCPSGVCCQSGEICCGDSCCAAGSVCSNGLCCPANQPVGCGSLLLNNNNQATGTCCPDSQFCADQNLGLCCNNGMVACGSGCCSSSSKCVNGGICCDNGIVCGNTCCTNGSQCNEQTGQCGLNPCGSQFCVFQECCNGVCCQFNQTCVNGVCTSATCPSGTVLCEFTPGQCCPPGKTCCTGGQCCDPATEVCCGGSLSCRSTSVGCGF